MNNLFSSPPALHGVAIKYRCAEQTNKKKKEMNKNRNKYWNINTITVTTFTLFLITKVFTMNENREKMFKFVL